MNKGKATCDILKQIRQQIADANGIEYTSTPCSFEGDCSGTCPKCESEIRFIERKLNDLQRQGRKIVITGLAAGMFAVASGSASILTSCAHDTTEGDIPNPSFIDTTEYQLEGDVYAPEIEPYTSDSTENDVTTPDSPK